MLNDDSVLLIICTASIFLPLYLCSVALLFTFFYAIRRNNKIIRILTPPHSGWFYAFAFFALAVGAIYQNWHGLIVFELLILLFLFGFYSGSVMNDKLCFNMIKAAAYGSLVAAAAAFIQKIPNVSYRSVSFFENANYYAFSCEVIIVVLIFAVFRYGCNPLFFISIAANIGGIIASGCRSAWLSIFFGAIVVMLCLKKYRQLLVVSVIGFLTGISIFLMPKLLFPRAATFSSDKNLRFLIWNTALGYIKSHPFFGQGMFTYFSLSTGRAHDTHAHDLILDMLTNFGIFGTAIAVVFAVFVLRDIIKNLRINPACAAALGIVTAALVHGVTDVPFLGLQSGAIFVLMFSLAGTNGKYSVHLPDKANATIAI